LELTDKKFRSYLDRLREDLEVLDETIATARKMSKPKGKADKETRALALQWAKTLRDLIERRETTLAAIKVHLLGRNETGSPNEPQDCWNENPEVMYERWFREQMSPWTLDDLKLRCEDCGIESEDVENHMFHEIRDRHYVALVEQESANLCPRCVQKREAARQQRAGERGGVQDSDGNANGPKGIPDPLTMMPASKHEIETILHAGRVLLRGLDTFPVDQRIAELEKYLAEKREVAPGMEPAYAAYKDVLQKALDEAKAEQADGSA
jgi:hypothetical protein